MDLMLHDTNSVRPGEDTRRRSEVDCMAMDVVDWSSGGFCELGYPLQPYRFMH